jgi:hypothetical protein
VLFNSAWVRRLTTVLLPILYLYQALDALFGGLLPIALRAATSFSALCAPVHSPFPSVDPAPAVPDFHLLSLQEYAYIQSVSRVLLAPFPLVGRVLLPLLHTLFALLSRTFEVVLHLFSALLFPVRWLHIWVRDAIHFLWDEWRGVTAYQYLLSLHRDLKVLLLRWRSMQVLFCLCSAPCFWLPLTTWFACEL